MSASPLRALMIARAHQFLADVHQHPGSVQAIATEAVSDEDFEVFVSVGRKPRPAEDAVDPQVGEADQRILAACTPEPQTAKRIANKLGRKYGSHLRGQLTGLCRRSPPLLVKTPDGYRLP